MPRSRPASRALSVRRAVLALLVLLAALCPAPLAAQQAAPTVLPEALPLACPRAQPARRALAPAGAASVVLLLELGSELSCALVTALGPWGLRVVEGPGQNPGPSMPSSALAAQRLAEERGARAVVWLARDAQGFALWVYDAQKARSLARPAPSPPFNASAAAALALSVKTVLRIVGLAPVPPSAPSTASAPAPPPPDLPSPPPAAPPEPSAVASSARWLVGVYAGARLGPVSPQRIEARYGAELRWSPVAGAAAVEPWLGLAFEAGSPRRVRGASFQAQLWDPAPVLAFGVSHALSPWLALAGSAAAALHVSVLSGVARDASVEDVRLNPGLRAAGELRLGLGRPVLALQPALEWWLRAQRFLVLEEPVLEYGRVSARLTVGLALPLD